MQSTLDRYAAEPAAGALALFVEYVAACINEHQTLRRGGRLYDDVVASGLTEVLGQFRGRLADAEHGVYEVRRVAKARGQGAKPVIARSVRLLERGTRRDMMTALAAAPGHLRTGSDGIARSVVLTRREAPPWAEHFYVVCPAVVADKARPHFEQWFSEITADAALF